MLIVTVPDPLPPDTTVIHVSPLDADHAQPAPAVTVTVRVPPLRSTVWVRGVTSNEQPGDWVTVTICPAMVSVPVRVGPFVAAIVNPTVPGPAPDAVATVIQLTALDAVHGQPAPAVTVAMFDPPDDPAEYDAGVTV